MNNAFRYASGSHEQLAQNSSHNFAASHALSLYRANAVYSYIPKNACSTLRYSLALDHGCIESSKDVNWIHKNNGTFRADLKSLVTAEYKFVILRCPFSRLASVYLDKIVGRDSVAWNLHDITDRQIPLEAMTFERFVACLERPSILRGDIHWRPQIDFLVYNHYDDYFRVEKFDEAKKALLANCRFEVHDARRLTRHGIDGLQTLPSGRSFASTPPLDILSLRIAGKVPSPSSLYNDDLVKKVTRIYQTDISLYAKLFGSGALMFEVGDNGISDTTHLRTLGFSLESAEWPSRVRTDVNKTDEVTELREGFSRVAGSDAFHIAMRNKDGKFPSKLNKDNRLGKIATPVPRPSFGLKGGESIMTIGSCFARNIEAQLKHNGFGVPCFDFRIPLEELWTGTQMVSGVLNKYTPHSMLHELELVAGSRSPADFLIKISDDQYWDAHLHTNVNVTYERAIQRRKEVRDLYLKALAECRIVIVTLGLIEAWFDSATGMYLNETPSRKLINLYPERFFFEVLSPENTIEACVSIINKLKELGRPDQRVMLTVSPIPIQHTFVDQDVIVANTYSKSILRVAAEVVRRRFGHVDYYPSYESVMLSDREMTWENDQIHVRPDVVSYNVNKMIDLYGGKNAGTAV